LAHAAYITATVFILLMFFSNFAKEAADIIHDAQPTDEIIDELMEV
jgi:hypothetical protein